MIESEQLKEAKTLLREACELETSAVILGPAFFVEWKKKAMTFLGRGGLCQACNLRQAVTLRFNGHLLCTPCWDEELREEG